MIQLTQNLKSGKMTLLEVPYPALGEGMLLVRNHFSLISAGTEGSKVETARKGYIGKALEKPDQVKQVLNSVKTEGLMPTYRKVMNKLDSPSPLGYSCAGEVVEVSSDITEFKVGDFVACGGATAVHADIVAVSKNLCVKIPSGVKIDHAAYTTVASIALQGIRQADLRLGESCAVIGLGLIGQLTIQMLKAAGNKVAGIDIDPGTIDLAYKSGADMAFNRNDVSLESNILDLSGGHGVDSVIITAGTSSLDPVELAGKLCRKRGKVIIVGAVPTGFSRKSYFKKELSLLMSCSYGPGRYDSNYEEKGLDYPIGFVRWTENRNMSAYLDLVHSGKMNIDLLTSHVFDFNNAINAYDMIVEKSESYIGILIKYDLQKELKQKLQFHLTENCNANTPAIGFIGAGSFAQKFLLPNAGKYGKMIGVATASGPSARNMADKYGFALATDNYIDIAENKDINTVFIATRHNLHAAQVLQCLKNGKNVFVEKPLCLFPEELELIKAEYEKQKSKLMVGFNRRFSPLVTKMIKQIGTGKKAINYRINAGYIPIDSWIQDMQVGGGRILGEVCHFIDLCMHISGSSINKVSAFALQDPAKLNDTLIVNLSFENGSIATISYFANGSKALKKEYIEVFSSGMTVIIDDFKSMTTYAKGSSTTKMMNQDKGHNEEVKLFFESLINGTPEPIPFEQTYISTLATFKVIESIRTGQIQNII